MKADPLHLSSALALMVEQMADRLPDDQYQKATELCLDAQSSCLKMIYRINDAVNGLRYGVQSPNLQANISEVTETLGQLALALQRISIKHSANDSELLEVLTEQLEGVDKA